MLFGPLLGQQPLAARVAGGSLVVETRMSLNMMSLTLEQVLNKRFRLLKDICYNMDSLQDRKEILDDDAFISYYEVREGHATNAVRGLRAQSRRAPL